ncbi:hypothetical protein GGP41_002813 [Bipolaris sorokiniana]|jgi:hypothetical protein|uniref:Uncharacterized protein n=2 Tax=Cochliobolus sativus TaxID=45130 RepID=A0A8H6DQC4_COCSA|nr:uncharacterized protein COCSADRAFT_358904 [Bipolaris sorokiniana ND90Pr]EMD62842.1 hypothetical protein COCSADRAFT_358904 [Bipolaris sorokiniana ND90Pr]KAF5844289.1 hypothetical protein GGP41_002813 [Bipolaris sorokiniana]
MATDALVDPGVEPHPQTGTSSSQPNLGEAGKLLLKNRRIASDRDEVVRFNDMSIGHLPAKNFMTLEHLRAAVFDVLVQRLKIHNIASPALKLQNFLWCLPTS